MKVLNLFVDICFFRRGPQDLPASHNLFLATLAAYAASGILALPAEMSASFRILHTVTDVALLVGLTWLLLKLRKFVARMPQTVGALAGTGTLFNIVAWPLLSSMSLDPASMEQSDWSRILLYALLAWSIAVTAHIIRQALEVTRAQSVLLVMIYLLASIVLTNVVLARLG